MLQECDVSVVLEAFLDSSLDEVLTWLSTQAEEVTAIEVGAGGYAPHPHLDPDALLTDASGSGAITSGTAAIDVSGAIVSVTAGSTRFSSQGQKPRAIGV